MTDNLRDSVIGGAPTNKIKQLAIRDGMETLRMAGQHKILEGRTHDQRGGLGHGCGTAFKKIMKNPMSKIELL